MALEVILSLDQSRSRGGEFCTGRPQRVARSIRFQSGDHLAGPDPITDIDGALDHASTDPKGQAHLLPRLDLPGETHGFATFLALDGRHSNRANGLGFGLFDRLAGGEEREERERRQPGHARAGGCVDRFKRRGRVYFFQWGTLNRCFTRTILLQI